MRTCGHLAQWSMAAHGSEAVMLRDAPARCGRGIGGSRRPSILELRACFRGGMRIAVAVGLLACFGLQGLWASTRAVPHRLTVHPNGATVAANQTQQFEVTDAEGRSVAVHWNISGLGCSGLACGSIDEQGFTRTPSSLPQPRVVTLEGVLVSDPSYSVLTQIRLEDAITVTVTPASAHVATGQTQQFAALMVGTQNVASRAELPPLPHAVAAAPVVARQNLASSAGLLPLPNAVPRPQSSQDRPLPAAPDYCRCRMRLPQPQWLQDRTLPVAPDCCPCQMRLPQPQWLQDRTLPAAPDYYRCRMRLPQPWWLEGRMSPAAPNYRRCRMRLPQPQ